MYEIWRYINEIRDLTRCLVSKIEAHRLHLEHSVFSILKLEIRDLETATLVPKIRDLASKNPGPYKMARERLLKFAAEFNEGDGSSDVFLVACKECFDDSNEREVFAVLSDEKQRDLVQCVGWDLISIVTDQLNDESNDSARERVLSDILTLIASVCSAREVCLCVSERLTQTLHAKCIANLISTLECAFVRLQDDWPKMLKSARPVIIRQLESFYMPADREGYEYESSDEEKLENDKVKGRRDGGVNIKCDDLLLVLQSVERLSCRLVMDAFSNEKLEAKRRELGVFLVSSLGIPLVHCQLARQESSRYPTVSSIREFAVSVMRLLFGIRFRAIRVMEFGTKKRSVCRRRRNDDDDVGEYYIEEKDDFELSPLACGCFAYLLLVEGIELNSFPSVYNSVYLLHINLPLIEQLTIQSTKHAITKGILLLKCLIERVNKHSLPRELLSEIIFLQVAKRLIDVMIHNSSRKVRKLAVHVLPLYLTVFAVDARYKVLLALLAATDHSGVASLLIHEAKDDVIHFIDSATQGHQPCVSSADIQQLFDSVFTLKAGKNTDLLQELDRIMAALNLLRFVLLRDTKTTNVTGVWSRIETIEHSFLALVRERLVIARTDWQHEVTKLKHQHKEQETNENEPEINVRLHGGNKLPDISMKQKAELAHSALISLDMLESVLARVCDIIATT